MGACTHRSKKLQTLPWRVRSTRTPPQPHPLFFSTCHLLRTLSTSESNLSSTQLGSGPPNLDSLVCPSTSLQPSISLSKKIALELQTIDRTTFLTKSDASLTVSLYYKTKSQLKSGVLIFQHIMHVSRATRRLSRELVRRSWRLRWWAPPQLDHGAPTTDEEGKPRETLQKSDPSSIERCKGFVGGGHKTHVHGMWGLDELIYLRTNTTRAYSSSKSTWSNRSTPTSR